MSESTTLIRLDDEYTIEPDTACWALHYRKEGEINPATGKPMLSRDDTYHVNLEMALKAYVDKRLKTDATNVDELLEKLRELHGHVKKVVSHYAGLFECINCGKEVHVTNVKCSDCRGKK